MNRPWGYYEILHTEENLQIKKIHINPGQRLSLQAHRFRSEHWLILSGTAKVERGLEVFILNPRDSIDIGTAVKHRISSVDEAVTFIEVQQGKYLGEDDIIRYEDDYGRLEG